MNFENNLKKLNTSLETKVQYFLFDQNSDWNLNILLGKKLKIEWNGQINCVHCGRITRKSYSQGYCFPCSQTVPEADLSIVKPELDMAHLGISKDMEWAKTHSLVEHYVYLADTSSLKVGITRFNQIPTRWIDQGATQGLIVAKVPYRNLAGQIELALKKHYADKTNWRQMLSCRGPVVENIEQEAQNVHQILEKNFSEYCIQHTPIQIDYPVLEYPQKVNAINLDDTPTFEGVLTGIKGQYLIFDAQHVINIRKYSGYYVRLSAL